MVDGMYVQGMGSDDFDYDNEIPTSHFSEVDTKQKNIQNKKMGNIVEKAYTWLQENALMYRGDNASDCMIAAFIAGFKAATKADTKEEK